jgi:hypothetical protein
LIRETSRWRSGSFGQMTKTLGSIALRLSGLIFLVVGVNINEPYLISLCGWGFAVVAVTGIVVFIFLLSQGCWSGRGFAGRWPVSMWRLPTTVHYRIFACAADAFGRDQLDAAMLRDSKARLKQARPAD